MVSTTSVGKAIVFLEGIPTSLSQEAEWEDVEVALWGERNIVVVQQFGGTVTARLN